MRNLKLLEDFQGNFFCSKDCKEAWEASVYVRVLEHGECGKVQQYEITANANDMGRDDVGSVGCHFCEIVGNSFYGNSIAHR